MQDFGGKRMITWKAEKGMGDNINLKLMYTVFENKLMKLA
jgi:hypothetical protein